MDIYNTYIHRIDPFALQFSENFGVRWYGLAYLAGILLGYAIIMKMIKKGNMGIKAELLSDFATWMAFGILIGGRVGYCVFYAPHLLSEFSSSFPFWAVLEVHKGGMASHGGIIGVSVACYLFARKHNINFLHSLDITVLGGSLGFFFGRIANFINGELYGREVDSKISWAVKFPNEIREWASYQPENLNKMSSLVENIGAIEVSRAGTPQTLIANAEKWSSWVQTYRTSLNSNWSVNQYIEFIQAEALKGNEKILEGLQFVLTARHPSQLYQAILEGLMVFLFLCLIWLKPRKPGVIAASFGFLYAFARILGEQYRMPDSALGFQLLGLTRGQWLSVGMVVAAFLLLFYSFKKENRKYGGWLS